MYIATDTNNEYIFFNIDTHTYICNKNNIYIKPPIHIFTTDTHLYIYNKTNIPIIKQK